MRILRIFLVFIAAAALLSAAGCNDVYDRDGRLLIDSRNTRKFARPSDCDIIELVINGEPHEYLRHRDIIVGHIPNCRHCK